MKDPSVQAKLYKFLTANDKYFVGNMGLQRLQQSLVKFTTIFVKSYYHDTRGCRIMVVAWEAQSCSASDSSSFSDNSSERSFPRPANSRTFSEAASASCWILSLSIFNSTFVSPG